MPAHEHRTEHHGRPRMWTALCIHVNPLVLEAEIASATPPMGRPGRARVAAFGLVRGWSGEVERSGRGLATRDRETWRRAAIHIAVDRTVDWYVDSYVDGYVDN